MIAAMFKAGKCVHPSTIFIIGVFIFAGTVRGLSLPAAVMSNPVYLKASTRVQQT